MNYLLDTHILLWWLADDERLKPAVKIILSDKRNQILVSHASAWEMIIKKRSGKLDAPDDLSACLLYYGFDWLPISLTHIEAIDKLPLHHADPFDRMLIVQAQMEGLTLITHDSSIWAYPLLVLKA